MDYLRSIWRYIQKYWTNILHLDNVSVIKSEVRDSKEHYDADDESGSDDEVDYEVDFPHNAVNVVRLNVRVDGHVDDGNDEHNGRANDGNDEHNGGANDGNNEHNGRANDGNDEHNVRANDGNDEHNGRANDGNVAGGNRRNDREDDGYVFLYADLRQEIVNARDEGYSEESEFESDEEEDKRFYDEVLCLIAITTDFYGDSGYDFSDDDVDDVGD